VVARDYSDHPEVWRQSMQLLADEVVPRLRLRPGAASAPGPAVS
jgi:hypothetical protein